MKYLYKYLFTMLVMVLFSPVAGQPAREFVPSGKASIVIFTNFHNGISPTTSNLAGFELERAYIGYEHLLSPEFSARATLDVGSPDDVSPYSKLRRYAYFKFAYLAYKKEKLELQFGLIGTLQFKLQEIIWERRYLKKAFADEYKFGPSADLGAQLNYSFSPKFQADFTVMNGEGYSSLQMDDAYKYGAGMTLTFPSSLVNRFYVDYLDKNIARVTYTWLSSFTYRKNANLTFEYNYLQNYNFAENHDLYGWSVFSKYNLSPKYQLFARYDKLRSNKLGGQNIPWHIAEDGSALIGGIQFSPINTIKIALNYQDWVPWAANLPALSFIYLNLEVKL